MTCWGRPCWWVSFLAPTVFRACEDICSFIAFSSTLLRGFSPFTTLPLSFASSLSLVFIFPVLSIFPPRRTLITNVDVYVLVTSGVWRQRSYHQVKSRYATVNARTHSVAAWEEFGYLFSQSRVRLINNESKCTVTKLCMKEDPTLRRGKHTLPSKSPTAYLKVQLSLIFILFYYYAVQCDRGEQIILFHSARKTNEWKREQKQPARDASSRA